MYLQTIVPVQDGLGVLGCVAPNLGPPSVIFGAALDHAMPYQPCALGALLEQLPGRQTCLTGPENQEKLESKNGDARESNPQRYHFRLLDAFRMFYISYDLELDHMNRYL